MANIKSAKKQAKQSLVRRQRNLARKSAIKTVVKKVLLALEEGADAATARALMQEAEARLARAGSKRVLHKNTAARKIGRLAKKVAAAERTPSR